MSVYGEHPTIYKDLSNEQLYSMFRESTYSRLNESEKLDLLQETVNRDALERGEIGAPEVRFADLPANESGNAADGVINVNRNMAVNGIQIVGYNGQTIQHIMSDYNCQTLNTVLHENVHCFQDQVIDGTISIDNVQKIAEYQANGFTESIVLQDGKYQLGSQYLAGKTANGYYFYYFQSTEKDAFLLAEEKTENILNSIIERYGNEASFEAYAKSIAVMGYHATEQEAIERFQNPDFVKDLNQVLQNQYFETSISVDPNTEKAVKAEMIATYQDLRQQIIQVNNLSAKENARMSLEQYKPVSLEEYNEALSKGYTMNYEHMKNDPTLTQEEFIQQASTMSEKYHEALQEFQEAQEAHNEVNINEANMNTNEEIQNASVPLDMEGMSVTQPETVEADISDDGVNTDGIDNDDGIANDSAGIYDSMDI